MAPPDTPVPGVLDLSILASSDDAKERASGQMKLTSTDLEMVTVNSGDQTIGLRYTDVTIPPGSTITYAYLQFTSEDSTGGATSLVIQAEDIADAPTFTTTNHNIGDRSKTTEQVDWNSIPAWTSGDAGIAQLRPDLSSVIQEVIDNGWSSGNALALIISGGSGKREAYSFDGDPGKAAVLHIEYTP